MHSLNRAFKVVYNATLDTYVAVSELTRGHSKSTTTRKSGKTAAALAVAFLMSGSALAGPVGGVVAAGSAAIAQQQNLTTIQQNSQRAVINWQGFNVGRGETVQFNHPNINAVTLNRVLSASPSLIDGALKANGRVFVVNAAGIIVGKNANIQVGGLTLSSLGISDSDFMAGRDKFSANLNNGVTPGLVSNEGHIETSTGGFVAMIGNQVQNSGVIIAREGMVALASGNAATLTIGEGPTAHSLVVEEGTVNALIEAGGAIRVDGGQIVLAARAVDGLVKNIINQTGVLEATSMTRKGGKIIIDGGPEGIVNVAGNISANGQTGGSVIATGQNVLLTGQISATGESDGGRVNIGGGWQGSDSSIAHATNVAMTRSASIDVSSKDNGNGGQAVLWSDNSTQFTGTIKATAGVNGGNGGAIETSGHNLGFDGKVDVSAPKGEAGNILLDPDIIKIVAAAPGAQDASLPTITSATNNTIGSTSTISVGAIEGITSGTVSLQANGYIQIGDLSLNGGDGEINMKPNVSLSLSALAGGTGHSFLPSANTYGGIEFVNSANGITATGTGSVSLTGGNSVNKGQTAVDANAKTLNVGHISTEAGNITLKGSDGLEVKGNLTTLSGNISLDGDSDQGGVGFLNVTSSFKTNSGAVTLKGGNSSVSGVNIIGNVDVGTGSLTFDATAGTFSGTYRIQGSVSAQNNLTIGQPVTLAGNAIIKTTGQLGFTGAVKVESGSDLTLTATSYNIAQTINGTGASITLKPAEVTDDLQLGTGGTGTNIAPVLSKLTNFNNVTIGGDDLQGKVTVSGVNNITGKLTIAAGGLGGEVVMQNGTQLTSNKDIVIKANESITAQGTALLTSTGGKVSLVTPGDLTLTAGTKIKSSTFAEISVDGVFTNPAGLGLIDAATPYWRLYVPNADSLLGTGFSPTTGFHRYGCTLAAGCAATTSVPSTGSGILFKDVPLLDLIATSGSLVYGNGLTTFGTSIDYSGLINGDTQSMAAITGTAGNANFSDPFTLSSGGYVNAGSYGISASQGSLLSAMGYGFRVVEDSGTATVTKRALTATTNATTKTYDGTTTATVANSNLNGVLAGDTVNHNVSNLTFSDKNAGTGKSVSGSASIAAGADGGNYTLSTATGTGIIDKKAITATANAATKTYDRTTDAVLSSSNLNGIITGDTVNYNISGLAFGDKNAGVGKSVNGTASITGGADASNYTLTTPTTTGTGTIDKKMLTGNLLISDKTYDGTTNITGGSYTSSGTITGDSAGLSWNGAITFSDKNAGVGKTVTMYGMYIYGTDAANYTSAATTTTTATINKKNISATLLADTKTYDGLLSGTGVGVLGTGKINGDTLGVSASNVAFADKNAGTNKSASGIGTLTGADAGNYNLTNTSITGLGTINKKALTAALAAVDKTYDATTAASATASLDSSEIITGDSVAVAASNANFIDKNAGSGKSVSANLSLSGDNANNYSVASTANTTANINKLTISGSIVAGNKTYDGTTVATGTGSVSGVLGTDSVSATLSNGNFSDKNAGIGKSVSGTITLAGNDAGNYQLSSTTATTTANIDKKAIAATLNALDKTYDATTTATATGSSSGFVSGDDIGVAVSDANFINKNAGSGKSVSASVALSGNDKDNYSLTSTTATTTADISKAIITGSLIADNKTYDGTVAGAGTGSVSGVLGQDQVGVNVSNIAFIDKNAGASKYVSADIGLSGTDAGNYELSSGTVSSTANIVKKVITNNGIVADNKTYDGTTTATGTTKALTGTINGDDIGSSITAADFSDKNAGAGKTVSATVALSGTDAGNYEFNTTSTTAVADITKKVIANNGITADNKTYDGNNTAVATASGLTDLIAGDSVDLNVSAVFSDKNAGSGKTVTGTTTLSGTDAGNYEFNSTTSTTTADITKRVITNNGLTVDNKTYDGTTVATASSTGLSNTITGDDIASNVIAADFDTKNAGTGKSVIATTELTGADAGNYDLSSSTVSGTGNIDKKVIANTGFTADDKVYDGNTSVVVASNTLTGIVSGDNVDASVVAQFTDKNAGAGKSVNGTTTLSGVDAGNYEFSTSTSTTTAYITKRVIVASGSEAQDKTYDGNTVAQVVGTQLGNTVQNDNVNVIATGTFDTKNAGNDKNVAIGYSLTGEDANNYSLAQTSTSDTANVGKKQLTATVVGDGTQVYYVGETTNPTGYNGSLSGQVSGDNVSVERVVFVSGGREITPTTPGLYNVGLVLGGDDLGNYDLVEIAGPQVELRNRPVAVIPATPSMAPALAQSIRAAQVDVAQQLSYVPVYANGRGIDSKGRTTAIMPEEIEADSLKGSRAGAVGVRGEPEQIAQTNGLTFKDPARVKEATDELGQVK